MGISQYDPAAAGRPAWNAGRQVGAKRAPKVRQIWSIRFFLDREGRMRHRALFDLAIDSKLRGCDLVKIKIGTLVAGPIICSRSMVIQQKTGRPVQFEITSDTRASLLAWLERRGGNDLKGPDTSDAVDEFAAKAFAEAPNFGRAIEAIRQSAQVHIHRGARWLQIRPLVIESGPGSGKTRLVHFLAEASGLQMVYLDCAAMTNMTPVISQDSSWSGSRQSDIMQALASSASANVIVVLDELDKARDMSRNGSPKPSEALVGLLEKRSAAAHMDNYLQLAVDLSFINWIILVNDATRLSQPFLERCQIIRMAPPTPQEIADIAAREIERRGLEPELVTTITRAVRSGKITSLRTLHKLLDSANAASSRSILN